MKPYIFAVACLPLFAMTVGADPMPEDCQRVVMDIKRVDTLICITDLGALHTVSLEAGFDAPVIAHAGAVTLVDADGNVQTIPWLWKEGTSACDAWATLEAVFPTCDQNDIIPETDLFAVMPNTIPPVTYCLHQGGINVDVTEDGTRDFYVPAGGLSLVEGACSP